MTEKLSQVSWVSGMGCRRARELSGSADCRLKRVAVRSAKRAMRLRACFVKADGLMSSERMEIQGGPARHGCWRRQWGRFGDGRAGGMTNPVCQWDKLLILDATEGIDGVALFIFSF